MASALQTNSAAVVAPAKQAQKIRFELEKLQLWDETRRLMKIENNDVAIPVKPVEEKLSSFIKHRPELTLTILNLPESKKVKIQEKTPALQLRNEMNHLMVLHNMSESLLVEVPSKWERHGDLVIIPSTAFLSQEWDKIGDDLWKTVTKSLSCTRLARHSSIADDRFRSSQVVMLLGSDGIVTHIDNGISYSYDVTKCMFSAGNITEKLRVASFSCSGETVVDLYAGIGYFTLPYLVHAKAAHVHACEWNPEAVKALKNNLKLNNVADRCTVHEGDNTLVHIPAVADRVNLGLIPTSEKGWPVAVRILKPTGGILHIHGNVTTAMQSGTLQPALSISENGNSEVEDNCGHKEFAQSHAACCSTQCDERTESIPSESVYKNDFLLKQSLPNHVSDSGIQSNGPDFKGNNEPKENDQVLEMENRCQACQNWSHSVQKKIQKLLEERKGGQWSVTEKHLEIVKSYAPRVLHCVLDLECRPC